MQSTWKYGITLISAIMLCSCGSHSDHDHSGHATEHDEIDEHHEHHEHGGDEIVLHRHEADELGVATATIETTDFHPAVVVGGEILLASQSQGVASAQTSGVVTLSAGTTTGASVSAGTNIATITGKNMVGGDAVESARIALQSAKAEYQRLKELYDAGLTTAAEYNAAHTAYELALNATTSVGKSSGATAPISGVITELFVTNGQYVEAGAPIAAISSLGQLTLRADVPARMSAIANASAKAYITAPNGTTIACSRKSSAPSSTQMPGYVPTYFSVSNEGGIVPGSYVEVVIPRSETIKAIAVPREAVIEKVGQKFVYVREDDDCYERRAITLGGYDGENYEVTSGLTPGDEVVVKGATFVRLAELSGVIPEGHTHNH